MRRDIINQTTDTHATIHDENKGSHRHKKGNLGQTGERVPKTLQAVKILVLYGCDLPQKHLHHILRNSSSLLLQVMDLSLCFYLKTLHIST